MTESRAVRDRRLVAAGIAPVAAAIFAATGSFAQSHTTFGTGSTAAFSQQAANPASTTQAVSASDSVQASFANARAEIAALRTEIKARKKAKRAQVTVDAPTQAAPQPAPAAHSTTGASGGG